jgi:hypothetical protein
MANTQLMMKPDKLNDTDALPPKKGVAPNLNAPSPAPAQSHAMAARMLAGAEAEAAVREEKIAARRAARGGRALELPGERVAKVASKAAAASPLHATLISKSLAWLLPGSAINRHSPSRGRF